MKIGKLSQGLVDLLFPASCIGCRKEEALICASCAASLPFLREPFCRVCAQPLKEGDRCHRCLERPLAIDGVRAPFLMEGTVRECIHRLKYNGLICLAPVLGGYLVDFLQKRPLPIDLLAAVPLHPKREWERGYNQAQLLATQVSRALGVPTAEPGLLVRTRATHPQAAEASAEARQRNVTGAFEWTGGTLKGLRVILMDDVCTTGATLESCAVALKGTGAASVWGLVVAREA